MDLIPERYRNLRRTRRALGHFAMVFGLVVAALLAGRVAIDRLAARERAAAQDLLPRKAQARQHSVEISRLAERHAESKRMLDQLVRPARPGLYASVLEPIDRALNQGVWFDELSVQGAAPVTAPPVPGVRPASASIRVTVRGKALDHTELARFVDALAAQPGLTSVRLGSTTTREYTSVQVLDFSMEAEVDTDRKAPS